MRQETFTNSEGYYLDRVLEIVGNHKEPLKVLHAALTNSRIECDEVIVRSSRNPRESYRVNVVLRLCTCPAGLNHHLCYHLKVADLAMLLRHRLTGEPSTEGAIYDQYEAETTAGNGSRRGAEATTGVNRRR